MDATILLRLQMNYDIANTKIKTIKKINSLPIITDKKKKNLVSALV